MKLEVVVIPVSDVDRAKRFYGGLGWRLDADFVVGDDVSGRAVHASGLAVLDPLRQGITSAAPGSAQGLYLVVSDIEAARAELVGRGVDVSEVFHRAGPGKPPRQRPGSGAAQLLLVRHVQRSGRQRLAAAGGHRAIARTRGRGRHDLHLVDRARGRAPARGGRARRAREADRRPAR